MNPFKRIAVTFSASLDQFISQIENHEAIAESVLVDAERAAGHARAQFKRIQSDNARIGARILGLEKEEVAWKERARKLHATSEADAMECARRFRQVQHEIKALTEQRQTQQSAELQLQRDLRKMEESLGALRARRNSLATRQAQSDAMQAISRIESGSLRRGGSAFDRWEAELASSGVSIESVDPFTARFCEEEEKAELKKTLDELLK